MFGQQPLGCARRSRKAQSDVVDCAISRVTVHNIHLGLDKARRTIYTNVSPDPCGCAFLLAMHAVVTMLARMHGLKHMSSFGLSRAFLDSCALHPKWFILD